MTLELNFPIVSGQTIPTDHGYVLYAALSRIVPAFHAADSPFRFAPINGTTNDDGRLHISIHSRLKIRTPDDRIRDLLPLAGKTLTFGETTIRLGIPSTNVLIPAPTLIARLVTFKNADDPIKIQDTARIKLAERGIDGEVQLPIHIEGPFAGHPKRRVLRIGDTTIIGYAMLISELSAEHSLLLQSHGLGGRTHMGCGFFVPAK